MCKKTHNAPNTIQIAISTWHTFEGISSHRELQVEKKTTTNKFAKGSQHRQSPRQPTGNCQQQPTQADQLTSYHFFPIYDWTGRVWVWFVVFKETNKAERKIKGSHDVYCNFPNKEHHSCGLAEGTNSKAQHPKILFQIFALIFVLNDFFFCLHYK